MNISCLRLQKGPELNTHLINTSNRWGKLVPRNIFKSEGFLNKTNKPTIGCPFKQRFQPLQWQFRQNGRPRPLVVRAGHQYQPRTASLGNCQRERCSCNNARCPSCNGAGHQRPREARDCCSHTASNTRSSPWQLAHPPQHPPPVNLGPFTNPWEKIRRSFFRSQSEDNACCQFSPKGAWLLAAKLGK